MLASAPGLTSIAFLDSLSFIPLCIVFLVALLTGPRPALRSFALISGVFVAYFAAGALALLGLQEVFDDVNAYLLRMWKSPYTGELILQIALGAALVFVGWRLVTRRAKPAADPIAETLTAPKAWVAGVSLTIAGLPGAVPYLAAVDLLLRTDLSTTQRLLLVALYNLVFVAPLIAVIGVRLAFGAGADSLIDAIRHLLDRWGSKLIVGLMVALGTVLIIDGIGWFLGHPLIPVGSTDADKTGSVFGQDLLDLGNQHLVQRLLGERTDDLPADDAVAVDQKCLRHAVDAPVDRGAPMAVDADSPVGIAKPIEKTEGILRHVLVVDAEDADTGVAGEFLKQRVLLSARCAP
jgi:hypothetical protein